MNSEKNDIKRIFLIVIDSFGIGEMPDAADYGDKGANTVKTVSKSEKFRLDTLAKLGFGNIDGVSCVSKTASPLAAYARMTEASKGKDTTIGHWEISGIISQKPLPTYPDGFPDEIIKAFKKAVGRKVLCNKPYSGTEVIKVYGKESVETGSLIVYTSADSVFQIAAHESDVSPETLYNYCREARKILCGKNGVGRVIARPFTGEFPDFVRTSNRRDFSLEPYGTTVLDILSNEGYDTVAVGKISDIFAGRGISKWLPTHGNCEGMEATDKMVSENFHGLCFINLVDFDMLYGHRNDIDGYAFALTEFDTWLEKFLHKLNDDDVLMITADHGCDPGYPTTDHTREYTPFIVYGNRIIPGSFGTRKTFSDIAATVASLLSVDTKGKISGTPLELQR